MKKEFHGSRWRTSEVNNWSDLMMNKTCCGRRKQMAEYWVAGAGKHEPAKVRLRKATFWNHILFFPFGKRAESSLRSGGFHYYSISRTFWMIKSLKKVIYVLWLLTCSYMSWCCTMFCNLGTSIWYSWVFHNVRVLHHVKQLLNW